MLLIPSCLLTKIRFQGKKRKNGQYSIVNSLKILNVKSYGINSGLTYASFFKNNFNGFTMEGSLFSICFTTVKKVCIDVSQCSKLKKITTLNSSEFA